MVDITTIKRLELSEIESVLKYSFRGSSVDTRWWQWCSSCDFFAPFGTYSARYNSNRGLATTCSNSGLRMEWILMEVNFKILENISDGRIPHRWSGIVNHRLSEYLKYGDLNDARAYYRNNSISK